MSGGALLHQAAHIVPIVETLHPRAQAEVSGRGCEIRPVAIQLGHGIECVRGHLAHAHGPPVILHDHGRGRGRAHPGLDHGLIPHVLDAQLGQPRHIQKSIRGASGCGHGNAPLLILHVARIAQGHHAQRGGGPARHRVKTHAVLHRGEIMRRIQDIHFEFSVSLVPCVARALVRPTPLAHVVPPGPVRFLAPHAELHMQPRALGHIRIPGEHELPRFK